ncbi:DUF971 domain-containing protein [Nitrosospira sp. NpAV]|uniref:DUF971 domain-containing protein n=1 Tax=Nitrosospira sp. NpAV TaxID=58133 RepID=UPI0005A06ECA|nr:DUF971 domain-containing protein [Nitrosospira sp. NpAV]KIO48393.1 hypothetical protein SQ11_11625 [Nitrosospira sp. NpAV]
MQVKTISSNIPNGTLEILWNDGKRQLFTHAFLRTRCQCAHCKSYRLQGKATDVVSPQLRISGIHPAGMYGVQFIFNDGHDRGIYPWTYLRDLAP